MFTMIMRKTLNGGKGTFFSRCIYWTMWIMNGVQFLILYVSEK